jgi:quercetin dioxygenase-like cupin family protein
MENRPTFEDLASDAPPPAGILSRTLHAGDGASLIHFGFAAGEELSEHTSSRTAVIHVLSGEFEMVVAGEPIAGRAGTWVRMPPDTAHSLRARVPATMLLTLLPREG